MHLTAKKEKRFECLFHSLILYIRFMFIRIIRGDRHPIWLSLTRSYRSRESCAPNLTRNESCCARWRGYRTCSIKLAYERHVNWFNRFVLHPWLPFKIAVCFDHCRHTSIHSLTTLPVTLFGPKLSCQRLTSQLNTTLDTPSKWIRWSVQCEKMDTSRIYKWFKENKSSQAGFPHINSSIHHSNTRLISMMNALFAVTIKCQSCYRVNIHCVLNAHIDSRTLACANAHFASAHVRLAMRQGWLQNDLWTHGASTIRHAQGEAIFACQ
jgi:hypothetical protein